MQSLSLTGPNGLLKQFTTSVLETALNEEMTEHLGRAKEHAQGVGRARTRGRLRGTHAVVVPPAGRRAWIEGVS